MESAMESTGVYWIPVYEVLEDAGLEVIVTNAREARAVPSRKSDADCYSACMLAVFCGPVFVRAGRSRRYARTCGLEKGIWITLPPISSICRRH